MKIGCIYRIKDIFACLENKNVVFDSKWYHRISKEQSHEEDI